MMETECLRVKQLASWDCRGLAGIHTQESGIHNQHAISQQTHTYTYLSPTTYKVQTKPVKGRLVRSEEVIKELSPTFLKMDSDFFTFPLVNKDTV